MSLEDQYRSRYEQVLRKVAMRLEEHLKDDLDGIERIDQIRTRAKSVDRFLAKAKTVEDGKSKYTDPLDQIQDQVGARVVVYYLDDVDTISKEVEGYYRHIEAKAIVPDSDKEFGYFGKHYIFFLPFDVLKDDVAEEEVPTVFELQIKTLFQHAWSEAEHDLGYKPGIDLTPDEKRKIAFSAAQAWGADQIFADLLKSQSSRSKNES